jgi:hypothetical protein
LPGIAEHLEHRRQVHELRELWQAKVLLAAEGKMARVVLSVLAHCYGDADLLTLLHACFPGFQGLSLPQLTTAGKIAKNGKVCADVALADGTVLKMGLLFPSERRMEYEFRKLADKCKLDDDDRNELFVCLRKWVVCDYRLDPTMDYADPDAKRLVLQ